MFSPKVLLISSRFDFSTDFISTELKQQRIPYLRINRDELKDYSISLNPFKPEIKGEYKNRKFLISETKLSSIYYRAPTFLRDIFQENISEEDQLIRTQWTAFIRSLCVFEKVKWVNNPTDTYKTEIKPFQLKLAKKIGFNVPETTVTNKINTLGKKYVAVKSLEPAIVHKDNDNEGFIYTEIYEGDELKPIRYSSPFFCQEGLQPKLDIRVTVIEDTVIAIKIFDKERIDGDWRRLKNKLNYAVIDLPTDIQNSCVQYVKKLNLNFGAIDLIYHEDEYYFIEINPTGEWSWLQQNTGFRIDREIVNSLNAKR